MEEVEIPYEAVRVEAAFYGPKVDFQVTNFNINIETKRQINFYNEIKTKQIRLLPNTWNLLSFNLINNNLNTVQALLNNLQDTFIYNLFLLF